MDVCSHSAGKLIRDGPSRPSFICVINARSPLLSHYLIENIAVWKHFPGYINEINPKGKVSKGFISCLKSKLNVKDK